MCAAGGRGGRKRKAAASELPQESVTPTFATTVPLREAGACQRIARRPKALCVGHRDAGQAAALKVDAHKVLAAADYDKGRPQPDRRRRVGEDDRIDPTTVVMVSRGVHRRSYVVKLSCGAVSPHRQTEPLDSTLRLRTREASSDGRLSWRPLWFRVRDRASVTEPSLFVLFDFLDDFGKHLAVGLQGDVDGLRATAAAAVGDLSLRGRFGDVAAARTRDVG